MVNREKPRQFISIFDISIVRHPINPNQPRGPPIHRNSYPTYTYSCVKKNLQKFEVRILVFSGNCCSDQFWTCFNRLIISIMFKHVENTELQHRHMTNAHTSVRCRSSYKTVLQGAVTAVQVLVVAVKVNLILML